LKRGSEELFRQKTMVEIKQKINCKRQAQSSKKARVPWIPPPGTGETKSQVSQN